MARQNINIGSAPNSRNGDPLRTAFTKTNQNFTELYSAVGTIPADVSDLTDTEGLLNGGNANTGDVTFDGVKVIGAGTDSGDGNGYATLELVPDSNLYQNGQYLVIDPTFPSHIHIRAGGLQDESNAQLFLGGENNHVRVSDYDGVRLQNINTFENSYYYDSNSFSNAIWETEGGSNWFKFTTTDQNVISYFYQVGNSQSNKIRIYYNDGQTSYALTQQGIAENVINDDYRMQVDLAPPTSPITVQNIEFLITEIRENYVSLENNDFRVDVTDDIRILGRDIFRLANYSVEEPIEISTDYDNNSWTWRFQPDGSMNFPDGGSLRLTNSIPASSTGSSGDKAGTVAYGSDYLYYCFQDYGVTYYDTTLSRDTVNSTVFYVAKSSIGGTPTTEWTLQTSPTQGGPINSITNVAEDGADWVITWSGGNSSAPTTTPVRLTQNDPTIWKRVAWSNDTW